MNGISNQARKEQTGGEFSRLKAEAEGWRRRREREDKLGQYHTQLASIKALIDSAAGYLQAQLDGLDVNRPAGEFYEQCRLFDLRVIWLRKVWKFYRDKFDQRDDENLRPVLKAADEVVWSCHRQVFSQAEFYDPDLAQGPAPLPFVEFSYAPESFPSELVPHDLKPDESGFLQDVMRKLPVPLVSLPESCVNSPWWLIYIGHEVGHHVQYALGEKQRFVMEFQTQVQEVVAAGGGGQKDVESWGRWGREIFADVFSVLTMGQWAAWAMVEFEMKKEGAMLGRRPQYPSPLTRLCLLAQTASALGLDGITPLRGLDAERLARGDARAELDLKLVPKVVGAALGKLGAKDYTLADLCTFDAGHFLPGGRVEAWADALLGPNPTASAMKQLSSPRLIASAALQAWSRLVGADEAERGARRDGLARDCVELIVNSREDGKRAGQPAAAAAPDFGSEMGDLLMRADQQTLELL